MRGKKVSTAAVASLVLAMAGAMFLAGCGGGTGNDLSLPVVTLSPISASVQAGSTLLFTATVVTPTSTTITWSVNGILGGNSTLGTITSTSSTTAVYTAPTTVPTSSTVTVKATSSAETFPSGAAIVTITPAVVNAQVTVAPLDSVAQAGTSVQYTATVTGPDNNAVTWYVNGVAGGNSTVGAITTSGLYQAPTTLPSPPTVVVTATSQADTSQSASTTLTVTGSNTAPLFVNFGPGGNSGNPGTAFYNGLFTNVTVCLPSTAVCQIIPDVLVDTSSVGLRIS